MREWNDSLYKDLQYTLEIKKMSNISDFYRILKTECSLQHFTRNCRIKNLDDFERDKVDAYLWRVGILNAKEKGITISYIMNRCLVMFVRRGKVSVVQYWWNIVATLKVNKWSLAKMAQQLKTKNNVSGQLFCCQCKAKFLLERYSLHWWSR